MKLRTVYAIAAVSGAVAVVGCGTQKIVTTPTPTSTPDSTTTTAYLGPPCSQMDAQNTSGYSMCDSGGSPCPNGWHAMQNQSGACAPGGASSITTDTTTTAPTDTTPADIPAQTTPDTSRSGAEKVATDITNDLNKRSSTMHVTSTKCVVNIQGGTGTCVIHAIVGGQAGDYKADLTIDPQSGDVIFNCDTCTR